MVTCAWHASKDRVHKLHQRYILVVVQELCESRGGRPGLSVLTSLLVSVDVKDLLNRASAVVTTCP